MNGGLNTTPERHGSSFLPCRALASPLRCLQRQQKTDDMRAETRAF